LFMFGLLSLREKKKNLLKIKEKSESWWLTTFW
jgi:hypothetical protein